MRFLQEWRNCWLMRKNKGGEKDACGFYKNGEIVGEATKEVKKMRAVFTRMEKLLADAEKRSNKGGEKDACGFYKNGEIVG